MRNTYIDSIHFTYPRYIVHQLYLEIYVRIQIISTRHAVGLYWVSGHVGVRGNEIANEVARDGSVLKFVGPEPSLGVSRQDIRRIRCWLVNQHWIWW